jgi:acetylglutamate kinase
MILFKLGGKVLENLLENSSTLSAWSQISEPFVVVHGGGAVINETAEKFGLKFSFVDGQRVTSPEVLDVVEMVLRGRMNASLVRALEKQGLAALGLSASDRHILECDLEDARLGWVGRVRQVRPAPLKALLESGLVPVIAPLGAYSGTENPFPESPARQVLNVNADMAAAGIATALQVRKLVFFTDRDGILDEQGSRVPKLSYSELEKMREGSGIQGGMLVKTRGVLEFLRSRPDAEVWVLNGLRPINLAEFVSKGSSDFGTRITA